MPVKTLSSFIIPPSKSPVKENILMLQCLIGIEKPWHFIFTRHLRKPVVLLFSTFSTTRMFAHTLLLVLLRAVKVFALITIYPLKHVKN